MRRHNISAPITDAVLNYINQNFITLFNEYVQAGDNARYARNKAEQAVADSLLAKETAEVTREEMLDIIREQTQNGDLAPEIAQARGGERTLGERLNSTDQQLAQTDDNSFYRGLTMTKEKKAQLVFVDDDCRSEVWTYLKPIVEQERVPISIAAITQYPETVNEGGPWLTLRQLKELQKIGFEIVSHTHTHQALGEISDSAVHYELATSKEWLRKHGFNHNILVYPFGSFGGKQRIVAQYYQAAIRTDYGQHLLNRPPILQMQLERVYYNYQDGTNDVTTCKAAIDQAVENDELLFIGMHCHYDGFDPDGLIEIIKYAKQRGIEIVTSQEAINTYGNMVDLPELKVGADGEIYSDVVGSHRIVSNTSSNTNVTGETPITGFKKGSTLNIMTSGSYDGLPVRSAGTLYTYRAQSDYLSYQEFQVWYNRAVYRRLGTPEGWGEWYQIYDQNAPAITDVSNNSINGNTGLEAFKTGITRSIHSNSNAYQGMPVSSAMVMYTHKLASDGYSHQIARPIYSVGQSYLRFYNAQTKTWGEWVRTSPQTMNFNSSIAVGTIDSGETKVVTKSNSNWTNDKSYSISPKDPLPNGIILDHYFDLENNWIVLRATNITQNSMDVGTINIALAVT